MNLWHNKQWLEERYYQDKWTLQKIANYCNCSLYGLFYQFKKMRIKTRTVKEAAQFRRGKNNPACQPGIGEKISQAKKGKKFTKAHKKALSKSWQANYEYRVATNRQSWIDHPEAKEKLRQSRLGKKASPKLRQKMSKARKGLLTGSNHWNWRGGTSELFKLRITDRNWHKLRKQVYERDNWTCQDCGKKCHHDIACHHIIPYRISKDDSMGNLITLCITCHSKREWEIQRKLYLNNLASTRSCIGVK